MKAKSIYTLIGTLLASSYFYAGQLVDAASDVVGKKSTFLEDKTKIMDELSQKLDVNSPKTVNKDVASIHDNIDGATTYNEEAKAISSAVANSNAYTDTLRQEVLSGSLSSSSTPAGVDFIASKTLTANRNNLNVTCTFTYDSATRWTKLTAIYSSSYPGNSTQNLSFSMPLSGYDVKSVTATVYYDTDLGTYSLKAVAGFNNGVFSCNHYDERNRLIASSSANVKK
jgi:hypothetical protein